MKAGAERPLRKMPLQPQFGMSYLCTLGLYSVKGDTEADEVKRVGLPSEGVGQDSLVAAVGEENAQDQDGHEGAHKMIEKLLKQLVTMMTVRILKLASLVLVVLLFSTHLRPKVD